MNSQIQGYASLRRYRDSKPDADYFLTINLQARGSGLNAIGLTTQIFGQCEKLETEEWWKVRTATVMPDHVYLLITLAGNCSLAECVRTFKGRLAPALRVQGLRWQDGFYDHRARDSSDVLPVFLYIFLNPYRAGLIDRCEQWPGYYCRPMDWNWFGQMTSESLPLPEWLR
jgi:REP element-mobilizing transposase RayT